MWFVNDPLPQEKELKPLKGKRQDMENKAIAKLEEPCIESIE